MSDNGFGLLSRVEFTLFLDRERVCMRCHETYTMRHNLGTLRCQGFHPLPTTPDGRVYACCQRRPGSEGCCGADHVERINIERRMSFEAANRLELTFEQFRLLAVTAAECELFFIARTWKRADRRAVFVVDRVDFPRYHEQRNVMAKSSTVPPKYEFERWRPDGGQDDKPYHYVVCQDRNQCSAPVR